MPRARLSSRVGRVAGVLVAAACFAAGCPTAAATTYRVVDVGAAIDARLGFASISSRALDVNAGGHVVGWVDFVDPARLDGRLRHPFFFDGQHATVLADIGEFTAVNDLGQAAGYVEIANQTFATIALAIDQLALLSTTPSVARSLNNAGVTVGRDRPSGLFEQAFAFAEGAKLQLASASLGSEALDINEANQVVGTLAEAEGIRGFVVTANGLFLLGTLGGTVTVPHAINDAGQIVGEAAVPGPFPGQSSRRAFVTDVSSGVLRDLGTLGGSESRAFDINEAGVIVGQSQRAGSPVLTAFVMEGGVMRDLNERLANAPPIHLSEARAINDAGWIAASGFDLASGSSFADAYLLVPVPAPPAWASLVAACTALAALRALPRARRSPRSQRVRTLATTLSEERRLRQ